ncbi:MAG TPA: YciI-like protein [Tepidiformaceae bacterium]|nr:YciI-like protein [Tepidiformaceae bacterium]
MRLKEVGVAMMYLLFYDYVENMAERRAPVRGQHLELANASVGRGELVYGGAFTDPLDGGVLLFRTREAAESFAANDPYVQNELVTRWRVREWNVVVGEGIAPPA